MKKLVFIAVFLLLINLSFALPNPAAVYCQSMGYTYNIVKTPQGEHGDCIFSAAEKCDEWQFFIGKCGQNYSYCVKNGYDIKTVSDGNNSYSPQYAVCVPKKSGQVQISVTDVLKNNMSISENLTIPARQNKTISTTNLASNIGGGVQISAITSPGTELFNSATGIETCSDAFEGQTITLTCGSGSVITRVWYSMYIINDSSATCQYPFAVQYIGGIEYLLVGFKRACTYNYGTNCVGRNSCSFTASSTNCGGDPTPGHPKRLVVLYECNSSAYTSPFDWRNVNSSNWMTPVKDQGKCGSCWAFGAVGTVEAQKKIEYNTPASNPDLSEQDLVSCSNAGDCNGGWPDSAVDYMQAPGVVDETCFPYKGCKDYTYDKETHYYKCNEEYPCSDRCSDWSTRLQKTGGYDASPYPLWIVITSPINSSYQSALSFSPNTEKYITEKGPVLTEIDMSSGHFVNGVYTGCDGSGPNHAIVLVGYNHAGNYWIAKNSWGDTWLNDTPYYDHGYFKIDYNAQVDCSVIPMFNVYTKPDTCTDSKSSITFDWPRALIKGNVSGMQAEAPYLYSDYCIDSKTLADYWCNWNAYLYNPGKLLIDKAIWDCSYLGSYRCLDGACKPVPFAIVKGGPNGQLYVPIDLTFITWNPYSSYLKIESWCNMTDSDCSNGVCGCNRTWCDQVGGKNPYDNSSNWPDGKVDMRDVSFIAKRVGTIEGETTPTKWDYLTDCIPDKKTDMKDVSRAAKNAGQGVFTYSTDLTDISVLFDTGDVGYPDANGYILIPSEPMNEGRAVNFTVYSGSTPVEALVTFYNSSSIYTSLAAATKPGTQVKTTVMMEPTQQMPVGNTWTLAVVIMAIIGLAIGYFILKDILVLSTTRKRKRK